MTDPGWLSVLPPLLAIALAIWSKQVILSLFAGIWMGFLILNGFNPLLGVTAGLDGVMNVFTDPGDTRVLVFTLLIGSLIATIEESGGVRGFVHFLESRRFVHNRVRAQVLAWLTGIVIFIESNITLLVAGAVSRPLFDRYRISREKLAYLIDATSAPVCVMIPLNAWGAVIIGLVAATGIEDPLPVFISSIPYNLYAITAIILSAVVIWKNINIGPMKAAEERTARGEFLWPGATPMVDVSAEQDAGHEGEPPPPAYLMMLPILAMILMMPIGLYITGNGSIIEGSGSESILWAISFAILVSWVLMLARGQTTINELMRVFMKGAGALLPIATILLLALALGDVAKLLGTGPYVAGVVGATVPEPMLAPLVFLTSAFIAFSVGSSWGTFAIMIPIAIPIATTLGLPVPLMLGAAISGAIFGDHASPISDTTVVASMASATDHIDHVRTQLPYALLAAAISAVGFFLLGLFA
ncbi:Na+/H+ antiporter NhaC family protein [Woeseia oceani]|uniref:C4-dicarboxylate ABC transporter n=1 Tax=Woeseia oceani TaxID=1548547 RepID=A0A193LJ81_9GAMM|nr:Na+/H+ antiporter NhaC family protein [Woeseia oceani]ANO52454.1 C4-dicarboxylate ABC transporter [Woeseia oceani]